MKAAELTSLLIRMKRRWGLLSSDEKKSFQQSENPFDQALVKTSTEGVLHYPSYQQGNELYQRTQESSNDMLQQDTTTITIPLAICKNKIEKLEQIEAESQELRKRRSDLLNELKSKKSQHSDKSKVVGEMVNLELEDKKLRQKRKKLINELKTCKTNEEKEGMKCLELLERAKERLESFTEENNTLIKSNDILIAAKTEFEDTMSALATELQKIRMENLYLQEVVVELQKSSSSPQQFQGSDQSLEKKLIQDKNTLKIRIEEAKQMRKEWDDIIQQSAPKEQQNVPTKEQYFQQNAPKEQQKFLF
jgi:hypothetical protein